MREVCRILRNSNINIVKNDIEFETIQEDINRDLQEERRIQHENETQLFDEAVEPEPAVIQEKKKVKVSFDEYQKLSLLIVACMKDFEANGMENV